MLLLDSNDKVRNEEEFEFTVDNLTLSGTLTLPIMEKSPCAILLSGYGAETRDYETKEFKRYKVLSEKLADNGIASLRFDDRGCGKSTDVNWHNYTFEDLANEAINAYLALKNHPSIDSNKIGFIGHSLGGAIAPFAASKNAEISFVVSTGPHGLIGIETAIQTSNSIAKAAGESIESIENWSEALKDILSDLQNPESSQEAVQKLQLEMEKKYQKLPNEKKEHFPTFESFIKTTYEGFLLVFGNTPMYRYFLGFDPQNIYKKVTCPICIIFAKNDMLHPMTKHKDAIIQALEGIGKEYSTVIEFNANHDFVHNEEKNTIRFVDGFCEKIINWINNVLGI